jgi:rhamnogalacturonyl hydrolase YesR
VTVGAASTIRGGGSWQPPVVERPQSIILPTEGEFGRTLDSFLPTPLRAAWITVDGAVRRGIDLLVPDERPTPAGATITTPLGRARDAQRALVDQHAVLGSSDRFLADGARTWRAEAWPMGQVLHGRIALAMQDGDWTHVDGMFRELESYRSGDGFVGGIGSGKRYYDDNEWIGLAAMQAYAGSGDERYLRHAERTFSMVRTGLHDGGGMYWLEQDRTSRNTCSVAPAGELAAQLYRATGNHEYLQFATRQADWLASNLRLASGLYADNVSDSGTVDRTTWTYNQGSPIGLDVQLYRATGEHRFLERAQATANATLDWLKDGTELWKQPPAFNAILFRNLLALDAVAPDPRILPMLDGYLDRVWTQARNGDTGLFSEGGIGHYGDDAGNTLDQGALSQLYAIRALPASAWASLT